MPASWRPPAFPGRTGKHNLSKNAFLLGVLVAISLAATDAALALKRMFPDSIVADFAGPALSIAAVLLALRCTRRKD